MSIMKNDNLKTALLNAMEADAKRLDNAAEHEFSPEFESAMMRAIKPKKPIRLKAAVISAAAAAAILATTVGVTAANGWSLKTAISGLFAEDKNDGSAFFGYDINGIGSKELDVTFERDGYTINMVGVVADEYTAYLIYDIVVEEGHIFQEEDLAGNFFSHAYSTADHVELDIELEQDSLEPIEKKLIAAEGKVNFDWLNASNTDGYNIFISQEGSVYHYATRFDVKPLSLENEELTFDLWALNVGKLFFDGYDPDRETETLSVKFDFINNDGAERLIEVNRQFEFDGEAYTLESVELTKLSVYLRITKASDEDSDFDPTDDCEYCGIRANVKLGLKDGSTTDSETLLTNERICYVGGDDGEMAMHLMWKRPVNVDEIKSITIGDTTFELD